MDVSGSASGVANEPGDGLTYQQREAMARAIALLQNHNRLVEYAVASNVVRNATKPTSTNAVR